jgi:hypothetical protein
MASLLFVGGPKGNDLKKEALTALKAAGHRVNDSAVYTASIADQCCGRAPHVDMTIMANFETLLADHRPHNGVQDPIELVKRLVSAKKPVIVYGNLNPARRKEIQELGAIAIDELNTPPRELAAKVQDVLQAQGAAVGAGMGRA